MHGLIPCSYVSGVKSRGWGLVCGVLVKGIGAILEGEGEGLVQNLTSHQPSLYSCLLTWGN